MEKKQLIIEKATELFAEKGIESTSIQQITDLCGISKGAFYLSFKSKDELILSIIDYFLESFTTKIDQVVNGTSDPQEKLLQYYLSNFLLFEKYGKFSKVFLKEQAHFINDTFLQKINYHNELSNQAILQLLDELYGNEVEQTKYDLLFMMKGFVSTYAPLLLSEGAMLDLPLLAETLVEKTNCVAQHAKLSFLTKELLQMVPPSSAVEVTLEDILEEIEKLLGTVTNSIESESLQLLQEELCKDTKSQAIISGLLHNLEKNSACHWLIYLVKQQMK